MKISGAALKGFITGTVMIAVSYMIYYTKGSFENSLQYITYSVYVTGILWTLVDFSRKQGHQHTFGAYFSQGFRCFIVVTLLMVLFTFVFLQMHPELKVEMADAARKEMLKKGNYTLPEIDGKIKMMQKSFLPAMLMGVIFGYLVIGALITAIASGVLNYKKRTNR